MSNAELIAQVKRAIEVRVNAPRFTTTHCERSDQVAAEFCSLSALPLDEILALLQACGTATPGRVRAALDWMRRYFAGEVPGVHAGIVAAGDAYRAALAAEKGEGK